MADSKMKLKLLVDKSARKVLFAEADKGFVDFLFTFSPPHRYRRQGLKDNTMAYSMVGCLGNLYQSIENLSETYIQPGQGKHSILNPRAPICATEIPLLLPSTDDESTGSWIAYRCPDHNTVADVPGICCPSCRKRMTVEMRYVAPVVATSRREEGGFVKGVVTYMVMDNLEVKPMSTISSITLLNKFNIKEVGVLEEKLVELGIDEALKLLKASMECKSVLTSVFLANNDVPVSVAAPVASPFVNIP